MAVSPRIFVSYRREDASGHSGRLYDNLKQKFPGLVFRDVDSLEPGDDFVARIEELLGSAEVMIAVIGRGWATDESGHRRIDEPDDWLRLEVGAGLRRNIRVIPVIVGGAKMPQAEELPDDLKALALRNSLEINDRDWESAQERLFATIERVLGLAKPTPEPPAPIPETTPRLSPAVMPLALVGAGMLAVGLFLRWDSGGHSFLQNDFGGNLPNGGLFTALAPVGIVAAAVLGALLVRSAGTRAVGVGILFGAGIAGVVKYLRVLQAGHDKSPGVATGVLVALGGGALVLTAAVLALRATPARESARNATAAILGTAGAAVMVIAIPVPFNGGGSSGEEVRLSRSFEEGFDPTVTSLAIAVIAALLLGRWRHTELSAALLTLGGVAALLWFRYFAIPVFEDSSVGSFAPGGLIGLAGALLVIVGGYLGLRGSSQHAVLPAPAVT
jgi:TIR domain